MIAEAQRGIVHAAERIASFRKHVPKEGLAQRIKGCKNPHPFGYMIQKERGQTAATLDRRRA